MRAYLVVAETVQDGARHLLEESVMPRLISLLLALVGTVSAYTLAAQPLARATPRAAAPKAVLPIEQLPLNLIAEIIDAEGERVYGAVEAVRPCER